MSLKISNVKKRLKSGEVCFGTMLRILKSPQAIALCASEGWDYVILDTEHNDYNPESLGNCSLVAKYEQIGLYVRVPDKIYHLMAQSLDIGAEGLVIPNVKTAAQAREIIRSVKYAPIGQRGVSISATATQYRNYDVAEYTEWANRELMTIIQIESEEGIENIDEILTVGNIDAVMIGPVDMAHDMGISGQFAHPRLESAFRKIIQSCNANGVAPGAHFADMNLTKKWMQEGMRFLTYSYDTKFFKDASQQALNELKAS
ncbi:MAG: hypothetical protein IPH58_06890 [Sphingobacteriales bacterium]|jgi:2-keto-3-deoxy-L-rhamnonate aldolase RhmA|nr:hypothetical protein [Sphingobacteriales bacterium]